MDTSTQNEIKKDPKAQGTHILGSYLKALKIPFTPNPQGGLLITTKTGATLAVVVGDAAAPGVVDVAAITSFELPKAMAALHGVTEVAGYGKPLPVNRGGVHAGGRISYNDHYEDVYLRHSSLRRAPDLSEADLAPYLETIKRCARKALFRWRNVFVAVGHAESDLVNVGRVYTTSFVHHYAFAANHIDNIKLLTEYLNQRFGEMAKITYKKALNSTCLPQAVQKDNPVNDDGSETSYIDAYATSEEASPDDEYQEDSFHLTFPDGKTARLHAENDGFLGLDMFVDGRKLSKPEARKLTDDLRNNVVKKTRIVLPEAEVKETEESQLARRLKARAELNERLTAMDKERRETILGYAAFSRDYAPDARREARRLADELACPKCKKKVAAGTACVNCEVAAVPRFGVDYLAFKQRLGAENHPMAEAMSAVIPESEQRSRAAKPVLSNKVQSLAEALHPEGDQVVVAPQKVVMTMTKMQRREAAKKLADALFASLPDLLDCPKCKNDLPKENFGIRVAHDKETGIPRRASRQSYCKACRRSN
jgi:uncharacterized protein YbaR (Trm112 family)